MRVIQIGPDSSRPGGMRTVMLTLQHRSLAGQFGMDIIPTASKNNRIKTFISGFKLLKQQVKSGNCGCVHIHMSENASVYRAAAIVHWLKIYSSSRVIVQSHGSSIQGFFDRCPRLVKRYLLNRLGEADVLVVLTPGWKKWWTSLLPNMKYAVIPNSVDIPTLSGNGSSCLNPGKAKILFMGELGERKGTYLLLSAIPNVLSRYPNVQFVFAGDGEVDNCFAFAKSLGVARNCSFIGWANAEIKEELLRTSEILVLPSKNESFGIVLLEAMSYGVAVICSDGGFMHEVVDNEVDGIVFPSDNRDELANAIIRLLDNPETAARMGEAGRIKVEGYYSTARIIELWASLYNEVSDDFK